jgi:hypothetical protein
MKNKYIVMGAVAAAGIAGAVALSQGVLAYRGNPDQTGPNYSPERHEQMQKAFDGKDGVFGVDHSLVASHPTNQSLVVLVDGYYRRHQPFPLSRRDDNRLSTFHDGHHRVGSP